MTSPLQSQILGAINSIRSDLYGSDFSIRFLKFNGVDTEYDSLVELTTDLIPSFDRTGNMTILVMSDEHVTSLRETTHVVFNGWLYELTEPAKPEQGPFPMWKATGRPIGSRYVAEP